MSLSPRDIMQSFFMQLNKARPYGFLSQAFIIYRQTWNPSFKYSYSESLIWDFSKSYSCNCTLVYTIIFTGFIQHLGFSWLNPQRFSFLSAAVMQTDGFEYLKESCPSVMTELLEYVGRVMEHSVYGCKHGIEPIFDGSDANGRRVKQRL